MLPENFHWHDYGDDRRLKFGARSLATLARLDSGRCRACFHPDTLRMRYDFFDSVEIGTRYVEAWAHKWETKIREDGDQGWTLYPPGMMAQPAGETETSHPRRGKRRR